jgi:hypothetical protein
MRLPGVAVLVFALGCSGCGGGPERSYEQGLTLVMDGATSTTDHLSPKPVLPAPSDQTNEGPCTGLNGDSGGSESIVRYYRLGSVSMATSDDWFDQAQSWWATQGYQVSQIAGKRGESLRRMAVQPISKHVGLVLQRGFFGRQTELIVESPCVSGSPSAQAS